MMSNYDRARPPRGWLYGVLLTILILWVSGVFWDSFRAQEIGPVRFAGGVVCILALILIAHQALTNDGASTSKETLVARRFLIPLGMILYLLGGHH